MKQLDDDIEALFSKLLERSGYEPPESLVALMVISGDYTREQAIAVLKTGHQKMLDWLDANIPIFHYMAASKPGVDLESTKED